MYYYICRTKSRGKKGSSEIWAQIKLTKCFSYLFVFNFKTLLTGY